MIFSASAQFTNRNSNKRKGDQSQALSDKLQIVKQVIDIECDK